MLNPGFLLSLFTFRETRISRLLAWYLNTIKFKHTLSNHNNQTPVFGNFRCLTVIERDRRRFHPDFFWNAHLKSKNIIPFRNLRYVTHPPLVWMLEIAAKNRQTYFGAIIRASRYSFEDSIQKKKAAYHILSAVFVWLAELIYNDIGVLPWFD